MTMRAAIFLISLAALAGCRGYSLDMSGLEDYAHQSTEESCEAASVTTLVRWASPGMEDAQRGLTMTDATYAMQKAFAETNRRLNMTELDHASTRHMLPAGRGMTMTELESSVSEATDPDDHKIK